MTRADDRGRVPLYHACTSYSGIAEDGDGGDGVVMMSSFGTTACPGCHSLITALMSDFASEPEDDTRCSRSYIALAFALRFEDPGVWTRADKRGHVRFSKLSLCTILGDHGGRGDVM